MRALVLMSLAACGRLGFDQLPTNATTNGLDDATGNDSALPTRLVFVTPATYLGDLSGMSTYSALDALCTSDANGNGHSGTYAVVLAFAGMDASTHVSLTDGRTITLVDGTPVATDATFFTASHMHGIDLDAAGSADTINNTAWTDFQADGTALGSDCTGWTDASAGSMGIVGSTLAFDGTWGDSSSARCNRVSHLICIQH